MIYFVHFYSKDVPVEYEYLRTVIELKKVRPNFTEVHGPVMRSGNTNSDVGKPSIDPKIVSYSFFNTLQSNNLN